MILCNTKFVNIKAILVDTQNKTMNPKIHKIWDLKIV